MKKLIIFFVILLLIISLIQNNSDLKDSNILASLSTILFCLIIGLFIATLIPLSGLNFKKPDISKLPRNHGDSNDNKSDAVDWDENTHFQEIAKSIEFNSTFSRDIYLSIFNIIEDSPENIERFLYKTNGNLSNYRKMIIIMLITIIQGLERKIRDQDKQWRDYFNKKEEIMDKYLGDRLEKYKNLEIVFEERKTKE